MATPPPHKRLLKPGITVKLFLAILAVCSIMALGMSIATRFSFQTGFITYLTEIEQDRMTGLVYELAEDYKQVGNWNALRDSKKWRRLINSFSRRTAAQQGQSAQAPEEASLEAGQAPPKTQDKKRPKKKGKKEQSPEEPEVRLSPAEQARQAWESAHLRSTLGLLDIDKESLIAGVKPGADAAWVPVVVEGVTVAWLTREPLTGITDNIDLRFQEQQRTAAMIIAALGLLLAAAAAVLMARGLVAPLRRFANTTSRLAAGDFSARVTEPAPRDWLAPLTYFFRLIADPLLRKQRKSASKYPAKGGLRNRTGGEARPPAVRRKAGGFSGGGDELQILAGQLNHLAGALERNEQARRAFMAEISHDLRTPIAVLRAEIEALEDGVRQVTPESLASLRAEVELLGRLVDDIHTLSLADVGMLSFNYSRFNLIDCLSSALYAAQDRAGARQLSLDREFAEKDIPVWADPARLGQVFRNILENSLRYTDAGGCIQVRCSIQERGVFVDFLDSAPAVPEEQLPFLFERFHTGDAARNRSSSGSGLGLAICRTLLEAQNGSIRALPSPLGGLWVRVQLPLADGKESS